MPVLYGRKVMAAAENRSDKVNQWMKATTKNVLHNSPDSEHVLSKDRALNAARYEAARAYFKGVQDGFQGTGWKKSWITSQGESCDECLANEDDGPIDVDDIFQSGDSYPLAHLSCGCFVSLSQ